MTTKNDPARANCTDAGTQTTNTTASAGLISSTAAASAVLEPSDPSWQNSTGLFTAQPPVESVTQPGVRIPVSVKQRFPLPVPLSRVMRERQGADYGSMSRAF